MLSVVEGSYAILRSDSILLWDGETPPRVPLGSFLHEKIVRLRLTIDRQWGCLCPRNRGFSWSHPINEKSVTLREGITYIRSMVENI